MSIVVTVETSEAFYLYHFVLFAVIAYAMSKAAERAHINALMKSSWSIFIASKPVSGNCLKSSVSLKQKEMLCGGGFYEDQGEIFYSAVL